MARDDPYDESRGTSRSLSSCPASDPTGRRTGMSGDVAPTVSVIITAYNHGDYLREAIRSVVAQTFTDWELIIVDDGSREDLSWVPSVDRRASLVRQRNQGVATARNHGISVSRARFIAFLDQDDRWRPTKLERQVELLRAGFVFCHTAFDLIDGEGSRTGDGWGGKVDYMDILAGRHGVLLSSSIVDRTVLQRVGLFDPVFRVAEDIDLFLRLARSYQFSYVPTVEVDYRRHAGNASKNYWRVTREIRDIHAREARLRSSRNDTAVAQAIRDGKLVVWKACSFQAIDAARSAARMHRTFATARHLVRATRLSPRVVQQSCAAFVKNRLHR
jgi:glycosyltransferase involved in cell wall biosynthesis